MRWRIRALRTDRTDDNKQTRQNGLPAVGYGPWSPVYSSTNPPYVGGPIKLGHTDLRRRLERRCLFARPSPHARVHLQRRPGDRRNERELFRIYVFTDRQCLNRVFTSAVIGGPAYAPRPFGPLALPALPGATPGGARLVLQ